MTTGEAIRRGATRLAEAAVEQPRRTAELILASVLGVERVHLIAHPELPLDEAAGAELDRRIARRASGEPLQYILGRQEFYGRDFRVAPGVLIPRPETELLVERTLTLVQDGDRICDVGAGSGAIALTVALERPRARVTAVDFFEPALAASRANAAALRAAVSLCRGDLLTPFRDGSFDLIVSNPPYVAESARPSLQRELAHEPASALFAGPDGLDCYRRLIPQAARALKPGGWLLLELGYDSLPGVAPLLATEIWDAPEISKDLAGIPRVVAARRRTS
jgi:release factor glutamine methyltransferase